MCGIIGHTGNLSALPILLGGLETLEYRGYDSAGVALLLCNERDNSSRIQTVKKQGEVKQLREQLSKLSKSEQEELNNSRCGIGHTRWATHGQPSDLNSHPHCDCTGEIAVVHNGICENHDELRNQLVKRGHKFKSATDTEVIVHLVEDELKSLKPSKGLSQTELINTFARAIHNVSNTIIGNNAICLLWSATPGVIYGLRSDQPLCVGVCDDYLLVTSDVPALLAHTKQVVYLENRHVVVLNENKLEIWDERLSKFEYKISELDQSLEQADKGKYADYMLKEIHDQPLVVANTIDAHIDTEHNRAVFPELAALTTEQLASFSKIMIVACGTSYHAGLYAGYIIEHELRIPVEVGVASEFRYCDPILNGETLVLAISQSGETADTLEAVKHCTHSGATTIAITNVANSRLTQLADYSILIKANLEVAVAATKSFVCQCALLFIFTLYLGQELNKFSQNQLTHFISERLIHIPLQIEQLLANSKQIEKAAKFFKKNTHSSLFIGRALGGVTVLEGALKLKEISYIHAEATYAGEIKHGVIALIDKDNKTPVVADVTNSDTVDKTMSNIQEVKARGAKVIALATKGNAEITKLADYVIWVPKTNYLLQPLTAIVPLQLLARKITVDRKLNVDKPRNLAKSVTVE